MYTYFVEMLSPNSKCPRMRTRIVKKTYIQGVQCTWNAYIRGMQRCVHNTCILLEGRSLTCLWWWAASPGYFSRTFHFHWLRGEDPGLVPDAVTGPERRHRWNKIIKKRFQRLWRLMKAAVGHAFRWFTSPCHWIRNGSHREVCVAWFTALSGLKQTHEHEPLITNTPSEAVVARLEGLPMMTMMLGWDTPPPPLYWTDITTTNNNNNHNNRNSQIERSKHYPN